MLVPLQCTRSNVRKQARCGDSSQIHLGLLFLIGFSHLLEFFSHCTLILQRLGTVIWPFIVDKATGWVKRKDVTSLVEELVRSSLNEFRLACKSPQRAWTMWESKRKCLYHWQIHCYLLFYLSISKQIKNTFVSTGPSNGNKLLFWCVFQNGRLCAWFVFNVRGLWKPCLIRICPLGVKSLERVKARVAAIAFEPLM